MLCNLDTACVMVRTLKIDMLPFEYGGAMQYTTKIHIHEIQFIHLSIHNHPISAQYKHVNYICSVVMINECWLRNY